MKQKTVLLSEPGFTPNLVANGEVEITLIGFVAVVSPMPTKCASAGRTRLQTMHRDPTRAENVPLQQRARSSGIPRRAEVKDLPVLLLRLVEVMRFLPGET